MRRRLFAAACVGLLAATAGSGAAALLLAQGGGAADLVLTGGKIITVDERFSIAQAIAVKGERIIAVGTNQEIARLAGPATRRIDLRGKAVTPGLIDNHMHLLRAGINWQEEVRWDGIASRTQALDLLRARARTIAPEAWVYNLGGGAIEQFADDDTPFNRDELDRIVPNHPVFLQASYREAYLNSRALQVYGIDDRMPAAAWVVRDASGRPTGRILEAGFRQMVDRIPVPPPAEIEASTRAMFRDLNRAGLTAFGSSGCDENLLGTYRAWAREGRLNVRVYCITSPGGAGTAEQVDQLLPRIPQWKLFQGDDFVDHVLWGEAVFGGGLQDPMFVAASHPGAEQLAQWRRVAMAIAKAGIPIQVHANLTNTLDGFLDQIEAVDKVYPIRNLRWQMAHANQLDQSHLARMKQLGMYAAVHPWAVINGGINQEVYGDAAYDMARLRTIQNSGITWGLGSDGSRANQILPFQTLSWAVTGRMVGGRQALRSSETISREDALIAHTRKNAYFVFRENDLGSLQPGKLADIVVLDRDYLTEPADQIKDIKSVMTIVGGRVAYDAMED
jgi:predicted amidohydrolase YtcJ